MKSPAAQRDGIAFTGADGTVGIAQIGVVLVVLGALGVYFARRRRNTAFTD
ncbi:MAG: LPXTG cell wall anchor domain-containing protein [Acidimicrobiales bacterium]|nr:LPXTG cell wall anchor domain-containing protein [Acidimicrobiales bacterium]